MIRQAYNRSVDFAREHPVITILLAGGVLRLLAVIFSPGYMASDDHFLVIRPAWDWLNGRMTWLEDGVPIKRGILYPYVIYALLGAMNWIGLHDTGAQMFVIRFLHATWSMTLIPLVYFFIRQYADRRVALIGGLIAATHFIMPFMAVRNLVEVISQPLVLAGLFLLENAAREERDGSNRLGAFLGGILLGASFMLRIQTAVFGVAAVMVLLVRRRWRDAGYAALGGLVMLLIEGLVDYLSFGYFLSSVLHSLYGQSQIIHEYVTSPWWTYIATITAVLIPPIGVLAWYFFERAAKHVPVSFWATAAFLLVHSIIPQKQERFLLPAFGVLIVLMMIGYSRTHLRHRKIMKWFWVVFWVLNLLLLPIGTFNYSQKARVEPLKQLGRMEGVGGVIVVTVEHPQWLPYYYMRLPGDDFYYVMKEEQLANLREVIDNGEQSRHLPPPTHLLLLSHVGPEEYLPKLEAQLGPLQQVFYTGPSLADRLLHMMNPRFNHSKQSWVFRIESPEKTSREVSP